MFDLITHPRDAKTGRVTKINPYRLHIMSGKDGGEYFERPTGSGNLYYRDGKPAGQMVKNEHGQNIVKKNAPHIEWLAPKTKDQILRDSIVAKEAHLATLDQTIKSKEQAAIKAEAAPKVAPQSDADRRAAQRANLAMNRPAGAGL